VPPLGTGVNEFEVDLLQVTSRSSGTKGFSEDDDPLADTWDTTLDHDEVVADVGCVVPSAEGVDRLLGDVVCRSSRLVRGAVRDPVDLEVSSVEWIKLKN
jgi:hypothetical protein